MHETSLPDPYSIRAQSGVYSAMPHHRTNIRTGRVGGDRLVQIEKVGSEPCWADEKVTSKQTSYMGSSRFCEDFRQRCSTSLGAFLLRLVANYRERSSKGLITRDVELGLGRSPSSRVVFIQKWLKLRPRTFSFLFSFRPKVEHFRLEPKTFIREHSYNLPRQTNEGRKESAPSGRPTFVRPWASPHSEWHCSVQNGKIVLDRCR